MCILFSNLVLLFTSLFRIFDNIYLPPLLFSVDLVISTTIALFKLCILCVDIVILNDLCKAKWLIHKVNIPVVKGTVVVVMDSVVVVVRGKLKNELFIRSSLEMLWVWLERSKHFG